MTTSGSRKLHRALAASAFLGGALAMTAGSPYPARGGAFASADVAKLASAVSHEEDHITAVELAEWIRARKPGLRILDLRAAAEFATYHLPRAEQIPLESLVRTSFPADETLILISDGGAHAAQAWVFLRELGHANVYFLRGGLQEWMDDVMNPTLATSASPQEKAAFERTAALSRYFGGVPRIVDAPGKANGREDRGVSSSNARSIRRRGC